MPSVPSVKSAGVRCVDSEADESIGDEWPERSVTSQTTAPAISLTPTPKDQLGKFAEGCLAVLKDRDMYLAGKTQRGAAD